MNKHNVKKFLTWEEKFELVEDIKEYVFFDNKFDPHMKEKISKVLIAKHYSNYSGIIYDRLADDNEKGYTDYLNIGKTYNQLVITGIYSDIVYNIDNIEYDSIIKLIDDSINEYNREINSFKHFMEQFSVEDIVKSIENLDHEKIDKIKAVTDKL